MFDRPAALWLLILAPLVAYPAVVAILRGARIAGATALALRLALLAVLVALVAGLRIKGTTAARSVEVVAVLDESRSVARDQTEWMYQQLHEVARHLSPRDRLGVIGFGRDARLAVPPSDDTFRPGQLSTGPPSLNKLPDDPAKLAALLSARKIEGGPKGPAEDFVQIGDMLRETYVRPSLRAAIFIVAKSIPGVRLLGTVTDQDGRSGIGLAYVHAWPALREIGKSVLIFDPKTSKLIAEETFVTYTRTGKTVLNSWTDYLKSGVVDSTTSTNPGSSAGAA